jgi:hypothetical protein
MLRGAYQKGQEQKGQVKADLEQGKERAQEQASRARQDGQTGARPAIG